MKYIVIRSFSGFVGGIRMSIVKGTEIDTPKDDYLVKAGIIKPVKVAKKRKRKSDE